MIPASRITLLLTCLLAAAGCGGGETSDATALDVARELTYRGRYAAAGDCLKAASRNALDPVVVALRQAEVRLGMGARDAAQRLLDDIPHQARDWPLYGVLRAWLLAFDGRALVARRLVAGILEQHPGSVEARVLLARLALQAAATMDLDAAARYSGQVLADVPQHRVAGRMLVESELRRGRFVEAAQAGRVQARSHPTDGYFWLLVGTAELWSGETSAAIEALKRGVDLFSQDYVNRLRTLWLLQLAWDRSGGAAPDLEARYRFYAHPATASFRAAPRFVDVAEEVGVARIDRGRGSSWLDIDKDGDWDLFSVGIHVEHALYRNEGADFTEVTARWKLDDPRGGWGAAAADVDDDGDPDLFVTRDAWEGAAPNSLYRNDGTAGFADVATTAGVAGDEASFTATWGDFDVDGRLDLFVGNGVIADGGVNALHHNQTAAGEEILFLDVAMEAGVGDTLKAVGTAAGDFDADGRIDLYCVNIGGPNRLYRNLGKMTFEDVAPGAGVVFPVEGGYVTFFLDYDNDGTLDLFVSTMSAYDDVLHSAVEGQAIEPNRPFLYRNEGDGTFTDVAVPAGLARSYGTMGAGVGDVDNDGLPDLYLANGGPEMFRLEPNVMFRNGGDGTFDDITAAAGVGNLGKGHGATFADYDADGDLDLYAGLGGHYNADVWPNALYRNEGPVGRSLSLRTLLGTRDAVGARITALAGGHRVHGQIASGYGFGSANAPAYLIGLAAADSVDRLEVVWPGGAVQAWGPLPADVDVSVLKGVDDHQTSDRAASR